MVGPGGRAPSWTDEDVEKYKQEKHAELQEGKKEELQTELKNLQGFIEEITKGRVDSPDSERWYVNAKIRVLGELLGK